MTTALFRVCRIVETISVPSIAQTRLTGALALTLTKRRVKRKTRRSYRWADGPRFSCICKAPAS
jgi:hypothetical protein